MRNLRIITAVADKGSFAAAADQLGLTQSAISLQIKKLEEELGVELFERGGRSPKLNLNGKLVVERAREIIAIYDGIKIEVSPPGTVKGLVTVGAVPTVITGYLPPVLGRLRKRHEEMHVKLVCHLSAQLSRMVEEGDLDAALTTEPPYAVPPQFEWTVYDEELFFIVAPKGTEVRDAKLLFERFPFVRFDKTAWAGAMVDRELMAQGIDPREVMEFNSLEAALSLVTEGLGIAVVPLNKQRLECVQDEFCLTPFGKPQLIRCVGMYQKRSHPRYALTRLILDELLQECGYLKKT